MINEFPIKIIKSGMGLNPSGNKVFEKGNSKRMGKKETEEFHNSVARVVFVSKRARPDIHQTTVVL